MRYEQSYYDCTVVYDNRGIIREDEIREISFNCLKNNIFELIEENQDIDIQSIEDIHTFDFENTRLEIVNLVDSFNELLRAVKQLDRQINNN